MSTMIAGSTGVGAESEALPPDGDVPPERWIGNVESALAEVYLAVPPHLRRAVDGLLLRRQIDPNELLMESGRKYRASSVGRKPYYTTGFIARVVSVSARTVNKWIDGGEIPGGFTLPGSKDRRVRHEDFCNWICRHPELGIELDRLFGPGWDEAI